MANRCHRCNVSMRRLIFDDEIWEPYGRIMIRVGNEILEFCLLLSSNHQAGKLNQSNAPLFLSSFS
jgi:hypothetical protein